MDLRLYGSQPGSVFTLNGTDENSATYALGWTLSKSARLINLLGQDLLGADIDYEGVQVELQKHGKDKGYTDIEIICPSVCHIIIEAKRLWELPGQEQLKKYADRIKDKNSTGAMIASLSAASQEYAARHLPGTVDGVNLVHRSWADMHKLVRSAYRNTHSFEEKLWLRELEKHLKGYVSMQNPNDNTVFVVSLSSDAIQDGCSYTWIDVIKKDGAYFHPVGNKWPVIPPNYIAFRHRGKLQSVHHIDSYEIVTDLAVSNSNWPTTDTDHFIYKLGPEMLPEKEVRNGKIWPSGRYWCAIDTLLSGAYDSISAARDETKRRLEAMED